MKFVTDFMTWLTHDGAPWRAYPQTELAPALHHRSIVAARPASTSRATWTTPDPKPPLAEVIDGLDHCDPRIHPREWLVVASRMTGVPIYRKDGQPIGKISDLSIDKRSGRIVYALVTLGAGRRSTDRIHPLPWSLLTYDLDKDGYVAAFDLSSLQEAPSLTREELQWFGAGDDAWREKLATYYSPHMLMPYV